MKMKLYNIVPLIMFNRFKFSVESLSKEYNVKIEYPIHLVKGRCNMSYRQSKY